MHELEVSPDGKLLAVTSHDGRLLLVHTDGGEPREVVRAQTGRPHSPAFSPDSRWLAWAHPGTVPLSQIKLCSTDDLSTVDVTELRFADDEPVFTSDGKYLAFLSVRTFDPVYDSHVFDVFFPAACRPYLVPLAALTPSPFAPQPAGRPFGADKPGGEDSGENGESKEPPRTEVDTEGLAERITPFPVPAADYYDLRAARGAMLWRRSPESGVLGDAAAGPDADPERPALERFDFEKRRAETFLEGVSGYDVSGDGKRLVVQDKQRLRALPSDRKPDGDGDGKPDDVDIDLSRARITVYPEAEWVQEYQEAGRLMRDNFWRADMGGVDWPAVLARYRPLVDAIGSHDDLIDLLWEVQGELGTSHAYAIPPGGDGDHHRKVGLLGADIDRDADGVWRVERVLPSDTSRPDARSPLAAPGVAVRAGDALLAVDGRAVDPVSGPAPLLVGAAGKAVELTVAPADGSPSRRVVVLPLSDDKPLRYQAWVADRRDYVHRISGGRVGYLHVPDMIASGWAQLHRDLRQEVLCEALIADVRENRGGHLSQLVVEKLARRVIGWTVSRDSNLVRTYPADAPRGPVVAVANEFSGSDGDIVNAAIKALGVAPVVGTRTWGGTIGIDMRYRLVDGTLVTQPKYASWMTGPGWGVENHGIDPDVEVVMTPQDWGAGSDPQLDTAVRIALERLEEQPAATPPEIPPLPAGGERT
jgi:tricorn protease